MMHQSKQRGATSGIKASFCVDAIWKDGGGKGSTRNHKKEVQEGEGQGTDGARACPSKWQEVQKGALHKVSNGDGCLGESSRTLLKGRLHPFSKTSEVHKSNPRRGRKGGNGDGYPNNPNYDEKESPHEEEPFYEEGPSELGVKTPHIVFSITSNTTPPQEANKEEEGGDEEKEEVAMDEANEEE